MSPPSPEQQDAALAALTGTVTEERPDSQLARDMLRLRLVMEAKQRGVPWTTVGRALGCSGKEAKRFMKRLAAQTQRELLAAKGPHPGGERPWTHAVTGEPGGPWYTVEGPGVRPVSDGGDSA